MEILAARERKVEGGAADWWDQLASQREREGRAVGGELGCSRPGPRKGIGPRARGGVDWARGWLGLGLVFRGASPLSLFFSILFFFSVFFSILFYKAFSK